MKKVLVIAYYFPPMGLSGVQRTAKFVKYLPDFGWKPFVLTINPTAYYAFDETLLDELKRRDVEIIRTDTRDITKAAAQTSGTRDLTMPAESSRRFLSALSQLVFIPDNKIGWKKFALAKASEIIERENIDVIFSTAPPFTAHLVGLELRSKYQLPLVVDFRDPWVNNPSHLYWSPFHKRRHLALEESVLMKADRVIAVNRALKEDWIKRYFGKLTHKDVSIIPHGFDPDDFALATPDKRVARKLRFVYSGRFYNSSPKPFFHGLKLAFDQQPELREKVEAVFVGVFPKEYMKLAESFGLQFLVESKGYRPHLEAVKEILKGDVLWATLADMRGMGNITAAKLFEYIAAGKTLFGIVPEGASKNFILDANGLTAHPNSPWEIAEKILELYRLWKTQSLPVPPPEMVERYNRRNLTEQLAREFEQLMLPD